MPRPTKWRKIENLPRVSHFAPQENAADGENILKLEELEAIRLKDLEGLEQEECAARMEVSRPTFQRILITARQKVADSLIIGKDLRIEGGHFTRQICPVICLSCGNTWEERMENLEKIRAGEFRCPECGSDQIDCQYHSPRGGGRGGCLRNCRRFGHLQGEARSGHGPGHGQGGAGRGPRHGS